MNFKLLCSDIDGTLLNKDRNLSSLTIQEIGRIRREIPVILISSRMPKAMRHLQKDLNILDMPIIAYNGGLILDQGEVLKSVVIDHQILENVVGLCSETDIHLSLYHNDDWFVPQMDYWARREINNTKVNPVVQPLDKTLESWRAEHKGAHKIMAMGDETEIDFLFNHLATLFPEELHLYRSKPTYIEIASKSISKRSAIQTLINRKYPTLSFEDVIAFGDNFNDIEMLSAVGMGIAVANARQEVLDIANAVTRTNIDDGVALSIQKYV